MNEPPASAGLVKLASFFDAVRRQKVRRVTEKKVAGKLKSGEELSLEDSLVTTVVARGLG